MCSVFGQQNSRGAGWQGDFGAQEMNYDSDLEVSNAHLHSAYGERLAKELSGNLGSDTDIDHIWGKRQLRPQIVTWDCWGFGLHFLLRARRGQWAPDMFFSPCLHPLHILYQCVVNRWFFGVSFGGLRGSVPMLPTDTNTLNAICVHQVMLDSLQSTFVRMWLIWCEQNLV